jgi:hypothetical protein
MIVIIRSYTIPNNWIWRLQGATIGSFGIGKVLCVMAPTWLTPALFGS